VPLAVTCVPGAAGASSVAPCSDVDGVPHVVALVEVAGVGPIDFSQANQLFAYGFGSVLMFWLVGVCIGSVLSAIKRF